MRVGRGRASGKIILFGEHAVVYGVPAIAAGIDRGAEAEARASDTAGSILRLGEREVRLGEREVRLGEREVTASTDELGRAFAALLAAGDAAEPVAVEARTDLPPGGGLGCSAALGVAIGRAVASLRGEPEDAALARASAWEGVFHGNPSGVDTATAALGGCLRFVRGEGVARVAPARDLWLAVASSGTASSTKAMVDGVARLRARDPAAFERTLEAFRTLEANARHAIEAGDLAAIGSLMDLAQMLLAGWMLSTEPIEELCRAAREAGALGAKLTGAGGGGAVVALAGDEASGGGRPAAERIVEAWRDRGFSAFSARVAREGGVG